MADIQNEESLFRHLIASCHIPLDFDADSWDDLAVETANRNYRGAVTTIFHPSFTWRRILQNTQRMVTHFGSRYYQGTLILERTFIIPVGREYFWNRRGRLQYLSINTLRVVCKRSGRSATGRRKYHLITAYPITP